MKFCRLTHLGAIAPFIAAASVWGQAPAPPAENPMPPAGATTPNRAVAGAPAPGTAASDAAPETTPYPETPSPGSPEYDAARLKIWESPEMKQARQWVEEYGRRSARFKPYDAQRFLTKLSQMSPQDMQHWLNRYTAHRANLARSAEVARAARQTAVDQTIARLQAVQQSYENFNQGTTEGALMARDRLLAQQEGTVGMTIARQADRDAQMAAMYATDYSWIVNIPLRERWMAAASLPGDLPAGDPRNFIRGDVLGAGDAVAHGPVDVNVPAGGPPGTEGGTGSR